MKKLFVFCSLFLLGVACSQDDSLTSVIDPVPEGGPNANPYAVTVEEALANLDQVLAQIDGDTRAGAVRRAVSVDKVKAADVCDLTRSEAALDVEDLLYVVSFGEGNGSAVLGADKRVIPVLAVLDETVLTPEDFLNKRTRSSNMSPTSKMVESEEELVDFVTDLMVDPAAIIDPDWPINPPIFPDTLKGSRTIQRNVNNIVKLPRLNTKWNQGSPYNNSVPFKSNGVERRPAGCTAIAVAQFLHCQKWPNPNTLYGESFDWLLISCFTYGNIGYFEGALQELADYIYFIGCSLGANYTDENENSTSAPLYTLVNILSEIGVSSTFRSFDIEIAKNIVINNGPFCMQGSSNSGAHAWVVDGWNAYDTQTVYQEFIGGSTIPSYEEVLDTVETRQMHCNMGWGGKCDGYYDYHVIGFNTCIPLDSEDVDTTIGDYQGVNGSNYDRSFYMVSY